MSRRQTLGMLSPNQLGRTNGPVRVAAKEPQSVGGQQGARSRKSLAPTADKGALLPTTAVGSAGSSHGAGSQGPGASGPAQGSMPMSQGPMLDPRRSSAYAGAKGAGGPKVDPRPVTDKAFFSQCIRTVITHLSSHGYPAPVSPKTLASPTAKDFTLIVQFLFQQFDSNMKTFGKIEDEVPMFFKRLNYPFQISKSALFAVGSPHSWPGVLAALTWLVELLNYNEKIESQGTGASNSLEDVESATKRQFFDYLSASYRHFLAGDDAKCAVVDEKMMSEFEEKRREAAAARDRIQQENEAVLAQIRQMQSEPSPLVAAQQRKAEAVVDTEKFQLLIENLQNNKASLQRKQVERQTDLETKQRDLGLAVREAEGLRARVASQPVNRADLARMMMERSKQKETLEAVTSNSEALERKIHQQEVQGKQQHHPHGHIRSLKAPVGLLVAAIKSLDGMVACYNQMAHRLKLVPASAKRADGVTFELRTNREAGHVSEFSNIDLKGVVKPGLERLCEQYRTKAAQLSRDLLSAREAVSSGQDALQERQQENQALEATVIKQEATLKAMRDQQEERVRGMSSQAERLQEDMATLKNRAASLASDLAGRRARAEAEFEATQRACEAELSKLRVDVSTALEAMLQHRVHVQQMLKDTLAAVKHSQQRLASCPCPA